MDEDLPVPIIDPTRCDGCGLCVKACLAGALALEHGKAIVRYKSRECSIWCEAICPRGAISLPVEIVLAEDTDQKEGGK